MVTKLKYHLIVLLFIQIGLFFLYGYHKMYDARPYSIHQWRQTDCASFTKNYYEEGMNFLQPKIHWQGSESGKAISEFPLVNFTVACLWKVFGEHEYLYRFTVLGIFLASIMFLFVMIYVTSNSLMYSYFGSSILTTSPVLAYYSFSFLADVPALSFAIISLSMFFIFLKNKNQTLFILSVLFGTIAVLLKASSATVLMIIGIVSMIDYFRFPKSFAVTGNLFKNKLLPILSFVLSAAVIYAWYHYAFLYNNKNSNGVFLMETLPVWKMQDKVIETARALYNIQMAMFLNKGMLLSLFCICGWLLLNIKTIPGYLQIALLISVISFVAFIVLFFQVFNVHDYYLINSMILPVIVIVCFGSYLKNVSFNFSNKKIVIVCLLVFGFNATYCTSVIRLRNINKDNFCKYYPFISSDEKNFSDWFHYNYEITLKPMETITPYLRQLGISRTDKVVSIPDPSFNISLYLMDQKGYTATEQSINNDSLSIQKYKDWGATYLILNDTTLLQKTFLGKSLTNRIGAFKNIIIYKLD